MSGGLAGLRDDIEGLTGEAGVMVSEESSVKSASLLVLSEIN